MSKINATNLPYILLGLVVFVSIFWLLNESNRKEQFANESTATNVISYILIGFVALFLIGAVLAAAFGKA